MTPLGSESAWPAGVTVPAVHVDPSVVTETTARVAPSGHETSPSEATARYCWNTELFGSAGSCKVNDDTEVFELLLPPKVTPTLAPGCARSDVSENVLVAAATSETGTLAVTAASSVFTDALMLSETKDNKRKIVKKICQTQHTRGKKY